jgi:DNA-binding IclR family transcriptional regulator
LSSEAGQDKPALTADRELALAVERSKAPAISRAVAVLRVLGQSATPLGVQSIARDLGLVPSTCFYVLRALVAEGLVTFDSDTKRYALGPGVLTLAQYWLRRHSFSELAQPFLDRIGQAFGVMVVGAQIVGLDHVVIVAVARAGSNIQFSTHIGSRFPALTSATGRCIAAFGGHSEADLEARFRDIQWDRPLSFEDWKAEVEVTRGRGFAADDGNYISGMTVISAPVWDTPGPLTHTIVAIGFTSTLERSGRAELERALLTAAQELSRRG